jgi:precorrin-6B methylase 2
MNKFLFPIYRVIVPKPLRTMILKKNLRKRILRHFELQPDTNEEQKEVLRYLENNEISIFPYPFHSDYNPENIEVFYDDSRKMRYVLQDGKRLYFKKRWTAKKIRKSYCDLMREQDVNSPHKYLTSSFNVEKGDVLADIGAAEGNFSLAVIEQVTKVYIFEYDPEWIEALKVTFEPWAEKVEIIAKFVSDTDDESHIRFDTFYKNNQDVNFLKIDVDGAESVVLNSCKELFGSGKSLKIALCTYHKNNDEIEFTAMLKELGFSITPSKGYMINYYDKKMKAPYLRRGLIRAIRD